MVTVVLQSCSPEFIDDVTCWGVVCHLSLGLLRPAGSESRKQTLQGPGVDSLQPCAPASEHSKGAKVEPSPGPAGLLSPSPAFPGTRRVMVLYKAQGPHPDAGREQGARAFPDSPGRLTLLCSLCVLSIVSEIPACVPFPI